MKQTHHTGSRMGTQDGAYKAGQNMLHTIFLPQDPFQHRLV